MDNKQIQFKSNDNGVPGGTVQFPNGGPTASVNVYGPATRPMYDFMVRQPINPNMNLNVNLTNVNPTGEAQASLSVSFKLKN